MGDVEESDGWVGWMRGERRGEEEGMEAEREG